MTNGKTPVNPEILARVREALRKHREKTHHERVLDAIRREQRSERERLEIEKAQARVAQARAQAIDAALVHAYREQAIQKAQAAERAKKLEESTRAKAAERAERLKENARARRAKRFFWEDAESFLANNNSDSCFHLYDDRGRTLTLPKP